MEAGRTAFVLLPPESSNRLVTGYDERGALVLTAPRGLILEASVRSEGVQVIHVTDPAPVPFDGWALRRQEEAPTMATDPPGTVGSSGHRSGGHTPASPTSPPKYRGPHSGRWA